MEGLPADGDHQLTFVIQDTSDDKVADLSPVQCSHQEVMRDAPSTRSGQLGCRIYFAAYGIEEPSYLLFHLCPAGEWVEVLLLVSLSLYVVKRGHLTFHSRPEEGRGREL